MHQKLLFERDVHDLEIRQRRWLGRFGYEKQAKESYWGQAPKRFCDLASEAADAFCEEGFAQDCSTTSRWLSLVYSVVSPEAETVGPVSVVSLPFNVFSSSAKALELLAIRSCRSADRAVMVDTAKGVISVDGVVHKAQPSECEIVRTLVEAAGQYVTGPELQHGPGCKGKKIWKVIKGVETAIPEITKYLEHGGNKGYRLLQGSD